MNSFAKSKKTNVTLLNQNIVKQNKNNQNKKNYTFGSIKNTTINDNKTKNKQK